MAEFQTIKERLICYIDSINISVRAFERECELSNGFVKNIRQSIQPDKLEKIAEHFPTLNKSWLMTGEGTMLKTDATAGSIAEAESREGESEEIERLKKEVDFLKGIISTQKATIDRLLSEPQPPKPRKTSGYDSFVSEGDDTLLNR